MGECVEHCGDSRRDGLRRMAALAGAEDGQAGEMTDPGNDRRLGYRKNRLTAETRRDAENVYETEGSLCVLCASAVSPGRNEAQAPHPIHAGTGLE